MEQVRAHLGSFARQKKEKKIREEEAIVELMHETGADREVKAR